MNVVVWARVSSREQKEGYSIDAQLRAMRDVERQIDSLPQMDGTQGKAVLGAFDLSQNLAQIWRGSNSALRRELLDCVSLNRTLSDVSLCLEKTKPFDVFAERPFLKKSRGDWI